MNGMSSHDAHVGSQPERTTVTCLSPFLGETYTAVHLAGADKH